jgi:putative heme iron utilization protein
MSTGEDVRRRTAAEEARTLVDGAAVATLATLSDDGSPWASVVVYAALQDGSPVLRVSTMAEHGRNLLRDPRASIVVADAGPWSDPLEHGRATLAGRAEQPAGDEARQALDAFAAAVPASSEYAGFADFHTWVLRVTRVRWVGGFARMSSVDPGEYAIAQPDPVASSAASAVAHLNADHADALLAMARSLASRPHATKATCSAMDRYGLELAIDTPAGPESARLAFAEPCAQAGDLRAATVELARRAAPPDEAPPGAQRHR